MFSEYICILYMYMNMCINMNLSLVCVINYQCNIIIDTYINDYINILIINGIFVVNNTLIL